MEIAPGRDFSQELGVSDWGVFQISSVISKYPININVTKEINGHHCKIVHEDLTYRIESTIDIGKIDSIFGHVLSENKIIFMTSVGDVMVYELQINSLTLTPVLMKILTISENNPVQLSTDIFKKAFKTAHLAY